MSGVEIISRAQWGARYAAGAGPAPVPFREWWLHHSVTIAPDLVPPFDDEDAAMRQLEQIGQDRFGQGVSYTFAVMPTGRVFEGHGIATLGAHTAKRNGIARAIVLVGDYDVFAPHPRQLATVADLLVHGQRAGWCSSAKLNGGHRQAPGAATACPGKNAMTAIAGINARAAALLTAAGVTPPPPAPEGIPVQLLELGNATGEYAGHVVIDWGEGTYWCVSNQLQLDLIRASGKVHLPSGRQPYHAITGLHRL